MKKVECSGNPYDIGFTHGSLGKDEVNGSLNFYKDFFLKSSGMQWEEVTTVVNEFIPFIENNAPEMLEEMKGVSAGSGVLFRDIVALNIRTEIAFGLFKDVEVDGCTSLAYIGHDNNNNVVTLGQTWDWLPAQQKNLIALSIVPNDLPKIKIVTEGGIIGKIGYNEFGVGVCLNAIRARGVSYDRWPIHLALRKALQSKSSSEAIEKLTHDGAGSASHILIAGPGRVGGIEFSYKDSSVIKPIKGFVAHSNHYIQEHTGIYEPKWLADSPARYRRALELSSTIDETGEIYKEFMQKVFRDEEGSPCGICKTLGVSDPSKSVTLFGIAMDLSNKKAIVLEGQPSNPIESFDFSFQLKI